MLNEYFKGRLVKAETKNEETDVFETFVIQHTEPTNWPEFLGSYIDEFKLENMDCLFRAPVQWVGTINFEPNKHLAIDFDEISLTAKCTRIAVNHKLKKDGSEEFVYKLYFKYDFDATITPYLNMYLDQKIEDPESGKMVKADYDVLLKRALLSED